ncbi:MAG: hypothetical protein PHZ19_05015 [Candidatus Thermoplasmatota archaeon]|nr:hypothetical protein [Candidatus Thermoplasmatota archaeon]
MKPADEAKPHCPLCGAVCRLQIRGCTPQQSQYKCPKCGKTKQGAALVWF